MPSLKSRLTQVFADAFVSLGHEARFGEVTLSNRPDLAHYQCNGALACAKAQKKNPREVAQAILSEAEKRLAEKFGLEALKLSIAGPGFINILLDDAFIAREAADLAADPRLGTPATDQPRTVVVDYGGPNVAKAMHVGHLRSSILGDALVRLHRFLGDTVIGDNHLGDWGTPMGMVLCELRRRQSELPYFDAAFTGPYPAESPVTMEDLQEIYPLASKRCEADEAARAEALQATHELQQGRVGYRALWQHFVSTTVKDLDQNFARLGIQFDHHLGESFYEDKMPPMIEELKRKGFAQMSEGALVIPLATPEEPDTPPLLLVKSGGGYLYHTSDLATVQYRVDRFKADLILYAIDKRQSLHFKQVFRAAKLTGIAGEVQLVHTAFGTMNGPDGKPFKTRAGGVLQLKDLIQMLDDEARKRITDLAVERGYSAQETEDIARKVGLATLRYADLKNNRMADYVFDLERFAQFEGNTGPYLLYAAVRIKSILRKAKDAGFEPGPIIAPTVASERALILETFKLPDVIACAVELSEPHHLADHGFALSQVFNTFYKDCHILREQDPARRASWLSLCRLTQDQLALCLGLLGIEIPERM